MHEEHHQPPWWPPWRRRLAAARHRGLLWLAGSASWTRQQALALIDGEQVPWVGGRAPENPCIEALAPDRARTRLGGESDCVVIDAHDDHGGGFDPDAFGALAGTVRAGGVLLLLTPTDWGVRADADHARLCDDATPVAALSPRYLARLASRLQASPQVAHWREGEAHPRLPECAADAPPPEVPPDEDCLTPDQAEAVRRLGRLRRRRPLVLTADRGRGKSAALGIAAARRLQAGERELLVTAPRPAAVAPLFERLAELLPGGRRDGNVFYWLDAAGTQHCVRFIAPDALSEQAADLGGAGTTLLVDEAAALPAQLLTRWLRAFPRIVFATTVHGYEGSGRGFALRFRAQLERYTPQWRAFELTTPVRWAPHDPLEQLTAELLCLDASVAPLPQPVEPDAITTHPLDRDALAADEGALRELFGLLVQAHYRTTPADLRMLLAAPGLSLQVLEQQGMLLGVAVCSDEGGFEPSLAEAVTRGERRPRGHLLAQSLAMHAGVSEAAGYRWRRVMRIAVHPEARFRGLGRRLLEAVEARARQAGIALLGASFGAEPGLMHFWQQAGFAPVRLGLTAETSTGEHALMVARGLTAAGEALRVSLQAALREQLGELLLIELAPLDPGVAATLLARVAEPPGPLTAAEHTRLTRFTDARAPLVPVRPLLRRVLLAALQDDSTARAEPEVLAALTGVLWQGRTLEWLAGEHGLAGRQAALDWLRARLGELGPLA
ncbi:tRNA(Met)-cytidine N(4)-acetyltransferase [Kushneria sinocarnis]|uniref:tRNA(Met) cytidine acetyltransferase TmcA n=1 Tax=Kushneria sinocarnis TaxID=595502 RepID=A0A420X197_9GAMM|nr:GNAT family N-acetyltransferase [Kushneria sinocarnis]RKR07517.1 tRNA(Met)-cytidine N(4)-acetyltransferase [Kushneria sinocarnis]